MEKYITDENILTVLSKIRLIEQELKEVLIDRDNIIKLLILCLIAKENILLLGPPGTAKSMLADELKDRIVGANIFKKLLTELTEESELFISERSVITSQTDVAGETKQKIYKSVSGMLPESDIAFLDEIFKANSAILNAMLTLINEKEYHINNKVIPSDLITVIGASNERPAPGSGLEALYDRFLIRCYIGYLSDEDLLKMLKTEKNKRNNKTTITKVELNSLNRHLDFIKIPDEIYDRVSKIKDELKAAIYEPVTKLMPSDRRLKNSLKILKAHALYMKRNIVEDTDINAIFTYILWDTAAGTTKLLDIKSFLELQRIYNKGTPIMDNLEVWNEEINERKLSLKDTVSLLQNLLTNKSRNLDDQFRKYSQETSSFISKIDQHLESLNERLKDNNPNEKKTLQNYKKIWDELKEDTRANMCKIADEYDNINLKR